jgi:hypothetical protein
MTRLEIPTAETLGRGERGEMAILVAETVLACESIRHFCLHCLHWTVGPAAADCSGPLTTEILTKEPSG